MAEGKTLPKRRLEEAWNTYRRRVISCDASASQLIETRRAFYAGGEALLRIQEAAYDGSTLEPTAEDIGVLIDVEQELAAFVAQVKAGVA